MLGFIKRKILNGKLGYRTGQEGIMSRYLREGDGWNEHLQRTKNYIIEALHKMHPKTIRVLGSGWLLDFPIDEVLALCERVVLVDIVHPTQILHKYKDNPKVVFETADLNNLYGYLINTPAKDLNFFAISTFIAHSDAPNFLEDLVISLNVLSQLNDYPISYLTRRIKLNTQQADSISQQIQAKHLCSLPEGRSILIADYEEEYEDEDGAFLGATPTVFIDFPRNATVKEWDWRFDTYFIYREDCRTTLKVMAVCL